MDKLRRALSGQEQDDEEQGFVAQVSSVLVWSELLQSDKTNNE